MDVLGGGLEEQEEEIMDDAIVPAPLYLSPPRSQSRSLLRTDSLRVSVTQLHVVQDK